VFPAQMSEGESDAMEAYEEEEIETDERGRKKMPSIDRLAREAVVNRWGGNRAVPAPHSPSLMTPHLLRQSCRTCLSIHPAMGTQTSGLCVFVHTLNSGLSQLEYFLVRADSFCCESETWHGRLRPLSVAGNTATCVGCCCGQDGETRCRSNRHPKY
jgi:hypothetical protein